MVKQVDGSCFLRSVMSIVFEGATEYDLQFYYQSLEDTYHFLREVVPSESHNIVIMKNHDHSALRLR